MYGLMVVVIALAGFFMLLFINRARRAKKTPEEGAADEDRKFS